MKTPLAVAVLLPFTALAHGWGHRPVVEVQVPVPAPVVIEAPAPVFAPPPAVAVPAWNRGWRRGPDRDDDVRDLWSVDGTVAELDRAAASGDPRLVRWVDARARGLLNDELRESEREAERARGMAAWGDDRGLRRAEWKLGRVAQLDSRYRTLAWRMDPWSLAERRAVLVDLDRVNRAELASR